LSRRFAEVVLNYLASSVGWLPRLALAAAWGALPGVALADDLQPRAAMETALAPFVGTYCVDCHSGDEAEAGLRLDKLLEAPSVPHHRLQWRRVVERLEKGEMPPEEAEQPEADTRSEVVGWLEAELADPDCSQPQNPGRVTMRRLNRTEYQNTIRDLTGVEFDAASIFPRDELAYGFDNNGDVLSLPPVLLEKYLQAAEQIAAKAIVTPESILKPEQAVYTWGKLRGGDAASKGVRALLTNGRVWAEADFDKPGEYLVRVDAFATQAGDEPTKMRILAGKKELRVADVEAGQSDPQVYVARFTAEQGRMPIAVDLVNDTWEPWAKDPNRRDRNLYIMSMTIVGPTTALEGENLPESHRRLISWAPTPDEWFNGDAWREPTRELIGRLLIRAYRRPPTSLEISRFAKLAAAARKRGDSFERSMQLVLQATLVSPQFLFRGEASRGEEDVRDLSEYELAARLSYFLWSSMPDDELLHAAAERTLRQQIDEQIARMLASPKSDQLVRNFGEQWLETRRLESMQRSERHFPEFDDELRDAFREETYRLLQDVFRNNRPLTTLLSADYSFVNARLAEHYGMPKPEGDGFVRVELPKERNVGILGHASVLSVTAFEDRTSPVLRGKWVLDHLLGDPPPPPPPGVSNLPPAAGELAGKSLRERLEVHRDNPSCAVCHNRMDPLGLAMENFDAVGRWRDADGDDKINADGELPDGRKLSGPAGLRDVLLADFPRVRRCLAEKLLTYALGRGLEPYDECAIKEIVAAAESNGDTFAATVRAVAKSAPFQKRSEEEKR
jgi:hypothetical protein